MNVDDTSPLWTPQEGDENNSEDNLIPLARLPGKRFFLFFFEILIYEDTFWNHFFICQTVTKEVPQICA